jgi:Zn-dependent protease
MNFIIIFFGWIFSLCLHEFSHALAAYFGGDTTVREKGYLTFNPLKYTHPMLSLGFPILIMLMGGIGLPGGAVYIESWRIRNKFWLSATSLAGPFANGVFALVLALLLRVLPESTSSFWPGISFLFVLQIWSILFNLIPIPPLDGYGVISPFLPAVISEPMERIRPYAIWVVIFALWFIPGFGNYVWNSVYDASMLFRVDWDLVVQGQGFLLNFFRF